MFKAVIVEDEKPILDLMKYVIGLNPHYTILGTFTNPLEALACLPHLQPDVVFLDVEMPKMNGLELAQKINELFDQTKIIFTTAYKQYALDAFQVYAFDYILKPVTPAAIERVTNRLIKLHRLAAPVEEKVRHATIRCFGGFEVRNSKGELVRWTTRKTEELFSYFLCYPERDINKWQLAELLWPGMDVDRASHNLHNTMYRLKKLLKEHEIDVDIQRTNEGYILEPAKLEYDVLVFQRYDFSITDQMRDAKQAEYLCILYNGSLLEGKDYIWKTPLEEGYRKQFTWLVHRLIQHDLENRDWKKAEQRLEAFLTLYPLNEEMNMILLQIYARCGNREKVAKQYARFEAFYRRELEMEPPEEMKSFVSSYLKS
ncbi:response regulator [Brevibacillus sp. SYSU BS000544]|uniref:response regulator n=1 Tax=Brevibacillus sp. SYSU BS000544 TaxID=3416443 RepID=UPI003CE47803